MSKFPFTKNIIAFRNKSIVLNDGVQADLSFGQEQAATISAELMQFGYILSPDAYKALTQCSMKFAVNWLEEIIPFLKYMTGGDSTYKPLHEGFPQTVQAMGEFELYWKAINHYWSAGKWYPDDALVEKGYKYESVDFTMIEKISEDDFLGIFESIAQANVPITQVDFEILEWYVKEYKSYKMPSQIPLKENLCMMAALGVELPVKTPTDVLRIATYLSNGTTDLIMPPKKIQASTWSRQMVDNPEYKNARFKKFKRAERRLLLGMIDKVANASEMVLRKERWIRLGEILHPGEYAEQFPKAFDAFNRLRNEKVRSWFGYVDAQFEKSVERGLSALGQRPGEFARRIDALIRRFGHKRVLEIFKEVAPNVSNKVLFELLEHFNDRMYPQTDRKVFIKGARRPTPLPTLPVMEHSVVSAIEDTIWEAFRAKFALLEKLGKVYIDPELEKIPLPKNMKTLTDTLKPKVRGTRMPLKADKKVLRAYVHWTAGVDLDLSMEFANPDKEGARVTTCSYHNLRPFPAVTHSGDVIPHHVGKHAEYIDIVLDKCPYKYGLITLRNFRGGSLKDKGAVLGFMEREHPEANKTWYPRTITDSYRLESDGGTINLAIIDFSTKEIILVDEDGAGIPVSTGKDLAQYIESISERPKVTVFDLLQMHATTRGEVTDNIEEADVVFKFEDFCESYTETIKYML